MVVKFLNNKDDNILFNKIHKDCVRTSPNNGNKEVVKIILIILTLTSVDLQFQYH